MRRSPSPRLGSLLLLPLVMVALLGCGEDHGPPPGADVAVDAGESQDVLPDAASDASRGGPVDALHDDVSDAGDGGPSVDADASDSAPPLIDGGELDSVGDAAALPDTTTPDANGADTASLDGDNDQTDGDAGDASPWPCPGPNEPTGEVSGPPATTACATAPAPAFFKGATPPKQTLKPEIGVVDDKGVFKPYVDGQWVPMVHGAQGGFHVWAAIRMQVPGATGAKIKIQAETLLFDGCDAAGFAPNPVIYPSKVQGTTYLMGSQYSPGLQVRFVASGKDVSSASSALFCNRHFDLRVAIRDLLTGAWGQTTVRVRTYDTAVAP